MQYDNHETDLYILPESEEERQKIIFILENYFVMWDWNWQYSNVKGNSWYGKHFIDMPFGIDLKDQIISLMKG